MWINPPSYPCPRLRGGRCRERGVGGGLALFRRFPQYQYVFKRNKTETVPEPPQDGPSDITARVDHLYTQVGNYTLLEAKVAALESKWESERMALAELYDKAYHMLQRHAKRQRDAAQEVTPEPEQEPNRIDAVTERVLARRQGINGVSPVLPR